jgi:hypothetical protein
MTDDILRIYESGLSVRQTAAALNVGEKLVRLTLERMGKTRTKSEGMLLRYNHPVTRTRDELVIRLPKAGKVIRSPYVVQQWFR